MRHYRGVMSTCAGVALAAPLSAFHLPMITSNTAIKHVCSSSCESRHDGVTVLRHNRRTSQPSWEFRGATARDRCTIESRRARGFELNAGRSDDAKDEFYTPADLEAYSAPWGIELRYRSTLNSYRIEAFRSNGELAGYTTGFYLGDLLHLDKVQIQRRESAYEPGSPNAPAPGTRDLPWAAKTGNLFQLGAVLGCAAVRYGWDRGAKRVELLAIRENERQHTRLVRYYRIAGFRSVREVGEDLGSFKDRLLWGAEGTLMVAEAADFMKRWTRLILDTSYRESATASTAEKQEA